MLTRLPRLRALAVMACVAGAVPVVVSSTVATAAPTASAASSNSHTCSTPSYPGSGYFNTLKTYRTSCKSGRKVVLNHYKCRVKHGRKGHCGKTSGYRCTEYRPKSGAIATQYNARVTCKKKRHGRTYKVVYTYQQDL